MLNSLQKSNMPGDKLEVSGWIGQGKEGAEDDRGGLLQWQQWEQ